MTLPSTLMSTWKLQLNFFLISPHQLSAAVNSWYQLLINDENENQPRELKFGICINVSVHIKIHVNFFSYLLSSSFNSCRQLITVDENENQPRELKFGTPINFSVYEKIPVEFCSHQLISAVSTCQQLITADNSWQKQESNQRA